MSQTITVTLSLEILQQLPQQNRESWIQAAIAEKLYREAQGSAAVGNSDELSQVNLTENLEPELLVSAESKAGDRLKNPIAENEWITVGTLDEDINLAAINQLIQERGYAG